MKFSVWILLVSVPCCLVAQELLPDTPIAVLDDKTVTYKQVMVSTWLQKEMDLEAMSSMDRDAALLRREFAILRKALEKIILQKALERENLADPTPNQVEQRSRQLLFQQYGSEVYNLNTVEKERRRIEDLIHLLETWQVDPGEGERLYQRVYAFSIGRETWENKKVLYPDPYSLKSLRALLPNRHSVRLVNHLTRLRALEELRLEALASQLTQSSVLKGSKDLKWWLSQEMTKVMISHPRYRHFKY